MAELIISIPDDLKDWAETRVGEGGYASISDYICDLIRRDRDETHRALQAAIDKGLASGVSEREPFAYLAELRDGLRAPIRDADAA